MNENEWMQRMEENSRRQLRCARLQTALTALIFVLCLITVGSILRVVPKVNAVLEQFDSLKEQFDSVASEFETTAKQVGVLAEHGETLAGQIEKSVSNLETITDQLAESDLAGMVENVDTLAVDSQKSIGDAMKKLDALDFDTLNKAIQNLSDVVEPLAKFFNVFNR